MHQEVEVGARAVSKELAKIIGVNEMTIVNLEKRKNEANKKNLERLQNFFEFLCPTLEGFKPPTR